MNSFGRNYVGILVGLIVLSGPAFADDAIKYAAPTEVINTGKVSGKKFLESGFSASEYKFFAFGYSASDGFTVKTFGAGKGKMKNITKYRFVKSDDSPVISGKCLIRTEEISTVFELTVDTKNGGLYKCDFNDLPEAEYALEVVVPQFASTQIGFMTIEKDDPHRWDVVKAKMRYKGVLYEASTTGIDKRREAFHNQPILGYVISRDGQPVGRLDFDFTGVQSDFAPKGVITAPKAEVDGREAVIFLASELLSMPDLYKMSNAF